MLKLDEEKKRFIEAIGNPSRLKILLVLWKSEKELTVYKICQRTGLGRSATSRHLGYLVDAVLVSRRIYGEIPPYAINRDDLKAKAGSNFSLKYGFSVCCFYKKDSMATNHTRTEDVFHRFSNTFLKRSWLSIFTR